MRPSLALQTHREAIRRIALRHHVKQVRVFGSVLHGSSQRQPPRSWILARFAMSYVSCQAYPLMC